MVTLIDREYHSGRLTFTGLSSDTKPEEIYINDDASRYIVKNGSLFYCIDNGDAYLYDANSHRWELSTNKQWVLNQLSKCY